MLHFRPITVIISVHVRLRVRTKNNPKLSNNYYLHRVCKRSAYEHKKETPEKTRGRLYHCKCFAAQLQAQIQSNVCREWPDS